MFHRIINPLKTNSFFIFGARGTGKSTFIQSQFLPLFQGSRIKKIDLLVPEQEEKYARSPSLLEYEILAEKPDWVFIDEVQKVPKLLNLVHRLIEQKPKGEQGNPVQFILSGSSARKLKRGASNLLAGRAFVYSLFPLSLAELQGTASILDLLMWGSLPKIFSLSTRDEKKLYLQSYSRTYLQEEIRLEQVVRKLDPFRLFLEIAAQFNGKILNWSQFSREVGVDIKTIQSYFQILEDTWVGFHLPGFHRSLRKSQTTHPKFYFFDTGVKRALENSLDVPLLPSTSAYGEAFEHLVLLEIYRLNEYSQTPYRLSYLRTKDGAEIDCILSRREQGKNQDLLIKIKSSEKVDPIEVLKLDRMSRDLKGSIGYYLSQDPQPQKRESILCLPWWEGLQKIFRPFCFFD